MISLKLLAGLAVAIGLGSPAPAASPAPLGSAVFPWSDLKFQPTKTGRRVIVFDAPTLTLDKFHLHITTLNPGQNTGAPHRHPQEEFIIVKEGTVDVNIDGRIETAGPGSMIFFAANERENMRNGGAVPATYYVLQFYTALTPKH